MPRQLAARIALFAALLTAGCDEEIVYDALHVQVTSEVEVNRLVLELRRVEGDQLELFSGADGIEHRREISNISLPYTIRIEPGDSISGSVYLVIWGMRAGEDEAVALWSGRVDLGSASQVNATLTGLDTGCDADGDGFKDCSKDGCCSADEQLVSDCADGDPTAHRFATPPSCIPCGGPADLNCDGTPDPCADADMDGAADCQDCAPGDQTIHPGAEELCDGKDNDCDGQTDEGHPDTDGDGTCDDADDDRDGDGSLNDDDCEPLNDAVYPGAPEICDNVDNDCSGEPDDVPQCGEWVGDWDGDGMVGAADCNHLDARFHEGSVYPGCCDPADFEGATDPAALAACDFDCDGTANLCEAGDLDGDGVVDVAECPQGEGDPTIYPGAPERCGDGIDQDCIGGDLDCASVTDKDGDSYGADVDCDDEDDEVYPHAPEQCDGRDNDCDGIIDGGNPGGGSDCPHPTQDTGVCAQPENHGRLLCAHGLEASNAPAWASDQAAGDVAVICHGFHMPPSEEPACDALDEDCDGATDEDFSILLLTGPETTQEHAKGDSCGVGECAGSTVICDPADPTKLACPGFDDAVAEACDGLDNDCDGVSDEFSLPLAMTTCKQLGECLAHAEEVVTLCSDAQWSCDYAFASYDGDAEVRCDGLDNDCDGSADEDLTYLTIPFGGSCKGIGACGGPGTVDGVVECSTSDEEVATCSTNADGSSPLATPEVCDGVDNDCNGEMDDGIAWSDPFASGPTYPLGQECDGIGACGGGLVECNPATEEAVCSTNPDGSNAADVEEECNGADDDCNGVVDDTAGTSAPDVPCKLVGVCTQQNVEATCQGAEWDCDYDEVPDYEQPEASCDGKDNDCDGETDELTTVLPPVSLVCNSSGVCEDFVKSCDGPKGWQCHYDQIETYVPDEGEGLCDDLDNDCDDETDEAYPEKGEDCFRGVHPDCINVGQLICNEAGDGTVCSVTGAPPAQACDDGDLTTKEDFCTGGDLSDCVGEPYDCIDDGLECTVEVHNGDGTCSHALKLGFCVINDACFANDEENPTNDCQSCQAGTNPNGWTDDAPGTSCDDGNVCTVTDTCKAGALCQGIGTSECDDGLSCTIDTCVDPEAPVLECDSSQLKENTCLIDGACYFKGEENPSNECQVCNPETPTVWTPRVNGTACSDGLKCTVGDTCQAGTCTGAPRDCDDGNECTANTCAEGNDSPDGCAVQHLTSTPCDDDGVACTLDVCNTGTCVHPVRAGTCHIGGVCRSNGDVNPANECEVCDHVTADKAWSPAEVGKKCDDENACTTADKCTAGGSCAGNSPTNCNDGNPCTFDYCPNPGGCVNEPLDGSTCPDEGLPCTVDLCVQDQCTHDQLAPGFCKIGESCVGNGETNPANPCEECRSLTNQTAYVDKTNGTSCNADDDGCTQNDSCQAGTCTAGPAPDCTSFDAPCTEGVCSSSTANTYVCAASHLPAGTACTDDGKTCTADECNGSGACNHNIIGGNCLIAGVCYADGESPPGQECKHCDADLNQTVLANKTGPCTDDGNACTDDVCAGGLCTHPADEGASCDDGEPCSVDDQCSAEGSCEAGPDKTCPEPTNPCKVAACDPETGDCVELNAGDGTTCDDGLACTGDGSCSAGACVPGAPLTDTCFIEGTCYEPGDFEPREDGVGDFFTCQVCQPESSATDWTALDGPTTCYDGFQVHEQVGLCDLGTCNAGVCEGWVAPVEEDTEPLCGDDDDNDCDGAADCADAADCCGFESCGDQDPCQEP